MSKRFLNNRSAFAALLLLGLLILLSVVGPLLSPYSYKEQLKNEKGEILSNMPPKIPALSFLGVAEGRRTLKDRKSSLLEDPARYPEGCILEVQNRRMGSRGEEYCDVVVDYYRYMGLGEEAAFWFGTDSLGRDLWTRIWRGTRISLLMALFAVGADLLIGVSYGAFCGFYGGKRDLLLMRFCEILQSIPNVILCTMFILLVGRGIFAMILALAARNWVETARLSRAQFLRYKNREFALAAQAMGVKDSRLIFRHILPNAMGPLITGATLAIPAAIFMESFLSYIGLGIPAPEPSLGTLLAEAQSLLGTYPHQVLLPALVIALLMLAFHLFSNGLRDAFDPRQEGEI